MNVNITTSSFVVGSCLAGLVGDLSQQLSADAAQSLQPAGVLQREGNKTLRMPPSPPPAGYSTTSALSGPLVYSSGSFPSTLADTGAFRNLATLTPHTGIVPYEINVPFWSDGAHKTRWFSVPNTNATIGFNRDGNWSFPTGTVWVKHFELQLTNGVPESAKRIETRFIVRNESGVYGVTYRWGNSLTNASLVPEEGLDETFEIHEGSETRTQMWHYPSRNECLVCHNPVAGHALGFNTAQLNRDLNYLGGRENQIRALNNAGYFKTNVTGIHTLRALAHATNTAFSLEYRVRSFLAANCVQCHQPGGAGRSYWDARITNSLSAARLVNGPLIYNLGNPTNRVIKPGDPAHSGILIRLATMGVFHMPPVGTGVLNTQAIQLLTAWITNDLPHYQSFADWQLARFGSTNAPAAAPDADPDADGASNYLEYLTGHDPLLAGDAWNFSIRATSDRIQIVFPRIANRGFGVQWTTNLFDPTSWQPLDVPGNEPFFLANTTQAVVEDTFTNSAMKFYRVRVFEP